MLLEYKASMKKHTTTTTTTPKSDTSYICFTLIPIILHPIILHFHF